MNLGCDQWTPRTVGRKNSSYYCDYQRVELTYVCWVQLGSEGRGRPLVSMTPFPAVTGEELGREALPATFTWRNQEP